MRLPNHHATSSLAPLAARAAVHGFLLGSAPCFMAHVPHPACVSNTATSRFRKNGAAVPFVGLAWRDGDCTSSGPDADVGHGTAPGPVRMGPEDRISPASAEVGTGQGSRQHRSFGTGLRPGCREPDRPDLELQPGPLCLVTACAIPGVQKFPVALATRTRTCTLTGTGPAESPSRH